MPTRRPQPQPQPDPRLIDPARNNQNQSRQSIARHPARKREKCRADITRRSESRAARPPRKTRKPRFNVANTKGPELSVQPRPESVIVDRPLQRPRRASPRNTVPNAPPLLPSLPRPHREQRVADGAAVDAPVLHAHLAAAARAPRVTLSTSWRGSAEGRGEVLVLPPNGVQQWITGAPACTSPVTSAPRRSPPTRPTLTPCPRNALSRLPGTPRENAKSAEQT